MRKVILGLVFGMLAAGPLGAQEAQKAVAVPEVGALIHESVAELPAPGAPEVPGPVEMPLTAASQAAGTSVRHGLTCVHAGWDFEGYRHFVEALKEDPECLMAHWGVVLSQLHASPKMAEVRGAAVLRMMALVDGGAGTELERRYVGALVQLLRDGPQAAVNAFAAAREEFPNDPQLGMFETVLGRGGFGPAGDATPDQERSEEIMRGLIERFPGQDYLRYAWLAMRAEGPDPEEDLEMARELAAAAPEFPPYQHLRGHYEWRCGEHGWARDAFGRAVDLYAAWMEETGFDALNCAAWTRAESYRAVALASTGQYDTALAVAESLAAIEVPPERALSKGARALLWEAKTLPARVLLRRAGDGDAARAIEVLPEAAVVRRLGETSLAAWTFQAHSTVVGARAALDAGDLDGARRLSENLTRLGGNFVKTRGTAAAYGERSEWLRAFKAFEVMASELRGLITMAGPKGSRATAYNWFRSAADRQERATLLMPPAVLLPMEVRLAQYFEDRGENDKAIEAALAGLEEWPNDRELLVILKRLFEAGGLDEQAAEIGERLEALANS